MKLAQLKIKNGLSFGVKKHETEPIFYTFQEFNIPGSFIDTKEMCSKYSHTNVSLFPSLNDKEVFDYTLKQVKKESNKFIWARFHEIEEYWKREQKK